MKGRKDEGEAVFLRNCEEKLSCLHLQVNRLEGENNRLRRELEESREKYANLLSKHITMMERCVGVAQTDWEDEK